MNEFLNTNTSIGQLMARVATVYEFKIEYSKDCENLSEAIFQQTGERISGSTIKRLLGFVKSTSKPNKFTLNLLSRYIGVKNYEAFEESLNAIKITNYIQEITNSTINEVNSKTSNSNLITNELATNRLNLFLNSDKTITTLIGDGGNGKTVFLAQYFANYSGKKLLFISSSHLNIIKGSQTISTWVNKHIEDIELLVIDGIEETAYNYKELDLFFIELSNLIATKQKHLKVVFSVRPFTWLKFRRHFNQSNAWFDTEFNSNDLKTNQNLSLLTPEAILAKFPTINHSLIELIRKPIFYQIYNSTSQIEVTNDWQLLNCFFKEKVYDTAYAYEKTKFFNAILIHSNYGKKSNFIQRKHIEDFITKHKKAHLDLLTYNIIAETKTVNKYGTFSSFYSFGHEFYLDFIILSHLLEENQGYNQNLVEQINLNYNGERKISLLKLALSFALGELETTVATFFDLKLSELERQSIMLHIVNEVRTNITLQKEILPLFTQEKSGRKYLIERWIDEGSLEGFYGDILNQYLEIVTESQDIIFANSLLYYNDYLQHRLGKNKYAQVIKNHNIKGKVHPYVLGRKYMTLLLYDFAQNKSYSKDLLFEIEQILVENLKEENTDLPVHSFGFEFNILHAEFLTGLYYFTPSIFEKTNGIKHQNLHPKDSDSILYQLFKQQFMTKTQGVHTPIEIDLTAVENLHPWLKSTVIDYLNKVK